MSKSDFRAVIDVHCLYRGGACLHARDGVAETRRVFFPVAKELIAVCAIIVKVFARWQNRD
jgi:hypothetical protein